MITTKHGEKAAFMCFASLLDYHIPKLARTELSGELALRGKLVIRNGEDAWKQPNTEGDGG